MRILPLSLAALSAAALLAACAHNAVPTAAADKAADVPASAVSSRFIATPPTIDGKSTDWGSDSLKYDANSRLQYEVLNDTRTLYVRLRSADASTQAKLALLGMVAWLDSTGRNQQQFGVHYPLPIDLSTLKNQADQRPAGAMGPSAAERQAMHVARLRSAITDARTVELLKFRGSKQPVLTDSDAPLGVKAALGLDEKDNLIYELAVPLRLIYKKVPALATGQRAAVGVWMLGDKLKPEPGSKQEPDQSMMQGGGLGSYGGRYGGMGGYGYGGGMGRGYRGGSVNTFQTFSLKTSAQLAGQ
ncbi:hypothetical protein [Hymenobacter polaris]|uniref:hypothetical protein n=1 Tax=Hymenobacter polaris TaxID=2682546 RepID=UPI0018A31DAB|nr:hypothetical protein [Hymenobacter polaris]